MQADPASAVRVSAPPAADRPGAGRGPGARAGLVACRTLAAPRPDGA